MSILLTPETQRLIEERLKQGNYSSADDLVNAALGALAELEIDEMDEKILDAIDRAEAQIAAGQHHDLNTIRQQWRSRLQSK